MAGETAACGELYQLLLGFRYRLILRHGIQDIGDRLHELYLTGSGSIRKGALRDPERLMGYITTVARFSGYQEIRNRIVAREAYVDPKVLDGIPDTRPSPEATLARKEKSALADRVCAGMPFRDREMLMRFYVEEQPVQQICRELHLTETQFRLYKSRAKAALGRKLLAMMAARGVV